NEKAFMEIARGIYKSDLQKDLIYSRPKDKEDKSLEIFKFYINSLYVALTRAMQNIFIIERVRKHPLLDLLDIGNNREPLNLKVEDSSREDWEKEAHKLELQGKKEQAEQIKKNILHTAEVPWTVMGPADVLDLFGDAFDKDNFNRQAKLRVFEYALVYHIPYIFERLVEFKFKKAANPEKERKSFLHKYLVDYTGAKNKDLFRKINLYGVDFRNPLNQTPLMIAAQQGNGELVSKLVEMGADRNLVDNRGMNALHIALRESYSSDYYAKNNIAKIYDLLAPDYIKVKIDNHLVKIDSVQMEYFLINSMISIFYNHVRKKIQYSLPAFETADFVESLKEFPEFVIPGRRKKRAYISSILAKNEIYGKSPYNRKLFIRVKRGFYLFNPLLEIDQQGKWLNMYDLLNLDALEQEAHDEKLQYFVKYVRDLKIELSGYRQAFNP
ncbi:MAG: ankyrin repeat domain-containing protein, partial [Nitrospinota bacterium]